MNKTRLLMILGVAMVAGGGALALAGNSPRRVDAVAGPCDPANAAVTDGELEFTGLLNDWRADSLGAPPMELSGPMNRAAQWFADQTAGGNTSGHIDTYGRDWRQRLIDCGYPEYYATYGSGESLGVGATAAAALNSMTTDDNHQSGIEAPVAWACVGVGRSGSVWVVVVAQNFESCPEPGPGSDPDTPTATSTTTSTPTRTSTPTSTPTPTPNPNYNVTINVCQGWNLVTIPVSGPVDDIFDTAVDDLGAIYLASGETWLRWAPGVPAYARNLSYVSTGDVLWMFRSEPSCEDVGL